jgi:hypothetical protein
MHHKAVLSKGESTVKPFHAQCSCGPTGDFVEKEQARGYLAYHMARLGMTETAEFIDETIPVVEEPEQEQTAS